MRSGISDEHPPPYGQEEIRRHNLGALLRYVHVHGPTSRADLTTQLSLNRSTIGALAADLVATGLVTETVSSPIRRAGRPSLMVSPCSERIYAHALSIETSRIRAARVGLGGHLLDLREAHRPDWMPVLDAVRQLAGFVRDMAGSVDADTILVGGAVAVDDALRDTAGRPRTEDADEALAAAFAAEFPTGPRFVINDMAHVVGVAEHVRGIAVQVDDLIYLHGDVRVSAGIITAGRLVSGHRGLGGQVGHMVVNPHGRPCHCGSRGCWETEIGERALLLNAGRDPDDRAAVAEVLRAADQGEEQAYAAVQQIAEWLGFGVANLVNLINPDLVVFGGSLREIYAAGAKTARSRLDSMALPASIEHVQLELSSLGPDAVLLGAAELAFGPLFADPLRTGPVPYEAAP
jgi:predicted NBD/HSP70 family sugar kinase